VDNHEVIQDYFLKGGTLPGGKYAVHGDLNVAGSTRTIAGAGIDATNIFSPAGSPSLSVKVTGNGVTIKKMTLTGYGRKNGFAFISYPTNEYFEPLIDVPVLRFKGNKDGVVEDVKCVDGISYSFQTWGSDNIRFKRVKVELTEGQNSYSGWIGVHFTGQSKNCSVDDVEFSSPTIATAFESFSSTNTLFNNVKSTNGLLAMNSAGAWKVTNSKFLIKPDARTWTGVSTPVFDLNGQVSPSFADLGGMIDNVSIIQEGYQFGVVLHSIYGRDNTPKIAVKNSTIKKPDVQSTNPHGAIGLMLWADNAVVDNVKVYGKSHEPPYYYSAGISVALSAATYSTPSNPKGTGSVKNSCAESIILANGVENINNYKPCKAELLPVKKIK
jgi:hypothetical protein